MAAPVSPLPQLLAYPRPELFTAQTPTSDLVKRLRPWPGEQAAWWLRYTPDTPNWCWVSSPGGVPRWLPGHLLRGTGVAKENWGHSLTTVISCLTPRGRAIGKERRGVGWKSTNWTPATLVFVLTSLLPGTFLLPSLGQAHPLPLPDLPLHNQPL